MPRKHRWKPALKSAAIDKIIDEYRQSGLSDSDIVTAINTAYGKEYAVNIVTIFRKLEDRKQQIDIRTLKIGSKVCYQSSHYAADVFENGIVKEVRETNKTGVWVVYNCAGNWDRFKDYTGALTDLCDLTLGWRSL